MDDMLTIELPRVIKPQDLLILQILMMTIDGVEDAGTLDAKIDSSTEELWLQIGTEVISTAGTALPLIRKVVDLVHNQGIKGGKLRFEGGVLDIDLVSTDQIEKLLAAPRKPTSSNPSPS